ncbi:ATP-binding protein [Gordonia hydrophobica]|uniref:histidine kinase n=1 Tax=Gordonia hydrophobica TaxID=40516 RepID=A0ABZ2TXC7_9ACTN|nr:ATP-binding protein [Gordonia hydrophobica]MBM7366303.1 two-component system CitB family sensor kinase [Gordonia hydrophobica]
MFTALRPVRRTGRLSLGSRVLILQIVVLTVSLGVGFGWHISTVDDSLRDEYAKRALAISQTVADDPDVRVLLAGLQGPHLDAAALRSGTLQREAVAVAQSTGVLFVVIANRDGIRVAHPDLERLGEHVSTDATDVLHGEDVLDTDRGTLGQSVRGKAAVRDVDGTVIGFVSTGISTERVRAATRRDIRIVLGLAGVALAVGVLGSALLARRWRRLTLGLQPDELVDLVGQQRAVLHALADGVLAVDRHGRLKTINDRARLLLGVDAPLGARADELGLPERLRRLLDDEEHSLVSATVGDRIVLASSRRIEADGRDLGMLLSAIDRTDVEALTQELGSVRAMSEALRAQRHETANRFHVLAGLLRRNHVDEAVDYLTEIAGLRGRGSLVGLSNVHEPHLEAFLDAKATLARERRVQLTLGPQTWVDGSLTDPVAVTTVVGNLLDNALDAAAPDASAPDGRVDVELVVDGETLWVTVADSGAGIVFERPDDVFLDGMTSKDGAAVPGGRGMGLTLARQLCRRGGGDVRVAHPGGASSDLGGAVFVAEMRQTVKEREGSE